MHRRSLLVALAGSASLGGCSGAFSEPASPTESASPTDTETSPGNTTASPTPTSGLQYTLRTTAPTGGATPGKPAVEFRRSSGEIVVAGSLVYGSSNCDEIAVGTVERTGDGGLRVVIEAAAKSDAPQTCTDDLARAEYELVVRVDDPFPDAVTVVERPARGEQRRRRATPSA
ncbi:MAG: hypothetical protein ABEJ85_01880 [Haloarculaceae archaeon]